MVVAVFSSLDWGLLLFASLGNWISFLGYRAIKKEEFALYHNLGFSTLALLVHSAVFMVVIAVPIGFLLYGLKGLLWPY